MPIWVESIIYICILSNLIPLIIGLYYYRYLTLNMRVLLLLYIMILLVEGIINYQADRKINNLWLFHIYTVIEYSLLTTVFIYWQKNLAVKRLLRLSIPLFFLIWMLAKFFIEDFNSQDNFTASLASFLLTCITLYTLLTYINMHVGMLQKNPWFWVSVGVLIYNTGNFFIFALNTTLLVWSVHNFLNIVANLCIAGGFLSLRH